jgi:D-tyrosyl-tRNA(Tyr) deacylase
MKVVLQRVKQAKVVVEQKTVGEIEQGYLLLVCFEKDDDDKKMDTCIQKILNLRIFEDDKGKMNLNISQVNGAILSISQFTLSWDGKKGHRPSFDKSMPPEKAKVYYAIFNKKLADAGIKVERGVFGEQMDVSLINDGPVTFHLEY